MNRSKFFTLFLSGTMGMLPLTYSGNVAANQINTATILTSSASPGCADYKLVGMCYWLFCTKFGCTVRTSVKVHHFIPEMVVSSYNHIGQSPWTEMSWMNQGAQGGRAQSPIKNYSQYRFKNAEAIGHPGGLFLNMISSMGYSCESQTTPFQPYFLSALDYLAWNQGVPEMLYPEALTPGMREVRANGDLWGNIYPRSGSVTQVHDYKAAGLIAQRVADIVSRSGQLHVYYPATKGNSAGYWPPKEVKEGDKKTHKWQMLSPAMSQSCSIFPDGQAADSYSSKLSEQGNYSWALWRPYACCKRRGQTFLGSTDWMSY
ncbi:TIGR03756 family integrating conjugative element protein [Actinobacillus porcinus]|uniref:TIGR03756 family integrating conjugative element protein n=1 Tax=Actinobacillus porcinus TaxID=51048 RepID=UPI002352C721|nr:TIGR03756 family integrating conjugative element protein [Actinobacillus porcinus]MCI5764014.1 TIGR03756 family integrating conjugative element protein [Actinobacillus porcinus]MDD7424972.1 TIGR03756 family integrating conjugative element protein [[Actinobacillus] rossii]MDY5421401.1 TIGR03756 family integrating conjugative element protein [Actinobacillus porcinus]